MTLPYEVRETRPTLILRAKRIIPSSFIDALIISLVALVIALALFGLFILITAGVNPLTAFGVMYRGSFGSQFSWRMTMINAAPLMLTALCVALPARVGLVIIGGEGCVLLGGLAAAVVAQLLPHSAPLVVQIAMVVGGMLVGGLWIAAVGALRQFRGVNETISSLLMNYIALAILNHCVEGVLHDPNNHEHASTIPIPDVNMLGHFPGTQVHIGLLFGLIACVAVWILMDHTTFGFATRIVGGNVRAAKVAGLSVAKYALVVCFLGGAFAALAGVVEVGAVAGVANDSLSAGLGYAGILVAFVARQNPLAIIPVAILLGGIAASGDLLKTELNMMDASVQVFQGILFLVILGLDTWAGRLGELRTAWIGRVLGRMVYGARRRTAAGVAHAGTDR